MYVQVISQRDIGQAFDFLLRQLSDLILDTPEAPTVIGNFMARCSLNIGQKSHDVIFISWMKYLIPLLPFPGDHVLLQI